VEKTEAVDARVEAASQGNIMVEEFRKLFTGLTDNFGKADMATAKVDPDTNKLKPIYQWAKESVTPLHYKQHLEGIISIGIQPCTPEGTANFGCIDIDPDNYADYELETYLKRIQENQLPLLPIKSKSGGLHCFVFLTKNMPAKDLRNALQTFLHPLKLDPDTEKFPKQHQLETDSNGALRPGNFINLPYFNQKNTERYAIGKNNKPLTLEEFINVANSNKITPENLKKLVTEADERMLKGGDPEFLDGPPCLQILSQPPRLLDKRDRFLYNYAVFAKKKYGDKWENNVVSANQKYLSPPIDKGVVDSKINSWKKSIAGHKCHEKPMHDVCKRHICIKRQFGILTDPNTEFPVISGLTLLKYKKETKFRFYVQTQDGGNKECTAKNRKEFCTQTDLLNLIYEVVGFKANRIKEPEFTCLQNIWRKNAVEQKPAITTVSQLHDVLYAFCYNGPQAQKRAQVRMGACWTDNGYHYFQWSSFWRRLQKRKWPEAEDETSDLTEKYFKAEFNHSLNDLEGTSNSTIKCIKLPQLQIDKSKYEPVDGKYETVERENENF